MNITSFCIRVTFAPLKKRYLCQILLTLDTYACIPCCKPLKYKNSMTHSKYMQTLSLLFRGGGGGVCQFDS